MYTDYFQLREIPFSITPDPAYLYLSPRHQEALGHLLYGTGQYGGFVQLTGEVGTGKTTVIRTLLTQKLPEVDVAMVHNPRQSELEFVQSICDELGVAYDGSEPTLKVLVDRLNEHLLKTHAAGRRTVLIIDEAQNLQPGVLEQVRLLTNLETHKEKLLRIMLVGQPELADLLARPDLRQLAQRITARYHLTPLDARETIEYIQHRLRIAGGGAGIFDSEALQLVHQYSRGVPRLINIICDRALLGAYATNARMITPAIVREAAAEAVGGLDQPSKRPGRLEQFWVRTERVWAPLAAVLAALLLAQNLREAHLIQKLKDDVAASAPAVAPAPSTAATASTAVAVAVPTTASAEDLEKSAQALPVMMQRLVQLWGPQLQLPSSGNVCRALQAQQMECYKRRGQWIDLRQINRPALLTLNLPNGDTRHVLLRALGADRAVLDGALGEQTYAIGTLDKVWSGEYLLLWRSQSGQQFIDANTRGRAIAWLAQRLEELGWYKPQSTQSASPTRLDGALRDALAAFQSTRGLEADGVAGIRTLIALSDSEPNTPLLGTLP